MMDIIKQYPRSDLRFTNDSNTCDQDERQANILKSLALNRSLGNNGHAAAHDLEAAVNKEHSPATRRVPAMFLLDEGDRDHTEEGESEFGLNNGDNLAAAVFGVGFEVRVA